MTEIVNTINLLHREDRLLSISKQAKEQGFALRIWEGVIDTPPHKGINEAYRRIVKDALFNNLPRVTIMEDDCVYSAPLAFKYYIDNIPEDFDIYLGMVYSAEVKNNRIMNGYSGNTLITISNQFMPIFLSMPPDAHPDRWCGQFAFERKYYVCHPWVCKQLNGISDNKGGRHFNYDVYLEGKEFFK